MAARRPAGISTRSRGPSGVRAPRKLHSYSALTTPPGSPVRSAADPPRGRLPGAPWRRRHRQVPLTLTVSAPRHRAQRAAGDRAELVSIVVVARPPSGAAAVVV